MSSSPRGKTLLDTMLLTFSAAALPLSWFLLRKSGRRGALAVTGACAVLFTRDSTMVLTGAPRRLRPTPKVLLFVELVTSGIAVATGARALLPPALAPRAAAATARQGGETNGTCSTKRLQPNMIAAEVTFFLHTTRQAIYISLGHVGVR